MNGYDKTELVRRRGLWPTVEQVELATLENVWWWNSQRLHGELDMRTPAEVEADYYAASAHPWERPFPKPPGSNETQDESLSRPPGPVKLTPCSFACVSKRSASSF